MRLKVVLSRPTLNLLWALSDPNRKWTPTEMPLRPDEAVVELDEEVVSHAIDLFDDDTFDEAVRRLAHVKLAEREGQEPNQP